MTIFLTPLMVMILAVQLGTQQWLMRRLREWRRGGQLGGERKRAKENAPQVALFGSINDEILIDSEEVTRSDALALVGLLATVGDLLANELTDVLDDHLSSEDLPVGKSRSVSESEMRR